MTGWAIAVLALGSMGAWGQAPALAPVLTVAAPASIVILGNAPKLLPAGDDAPDTTYARSFPGAWSSLAVGALDALGGLRLEDLAGLVPGLQPDVSNAGLSSAVKLRGFAVTRLFYNGLPDVQRMFSRELSTVERIDVLAGPAALFFGSVSPGGVVNYQGKQPLFTDQRVVSLRLDEQGVGQAQLDLAGALSDAWAYRLVAAAQDGAEPVAQLPQRRNTTLGALTWRYAADSQLTLEAELMQNRTPFVFGTVIVGKGEAAQVQYDKLYVQPGGAHTERQMRRWALDWRATVLQRIALDARYAEAAATRDEALLGFFALLSPTSLSGYYTRYQDDFNQRSLRLRAQANLAWGVVQHQLAAGVMAHRQRWLFEGVQNIGGFKLSVAQPDFSAVDRTMLKLSPRFSREHQREDAAWLADRIVLSEPLTLTAGLRQTRFGIAADRSGAGLLPASEGSGLAHHLGLTLQPLPSLQASLVHSSGLEANRGKTHDGGYLNPQQQRQWEANLHWDALPRLALDAAVYRLRLANLPMTDPADRNAVVTTGQRQVQGAQLAVKGQLGRWSMQGHAHALATRQVVRTSASLGDQFVGVAQRTAGLNLGWQPPAWHAALPKLTLAAAWVGPQYADAANTTRLPGYSLLHGSAHWPLDGHTSLSIGVRNLLDRRYVEAVTALDDVYQGPRRRAWLRLSWSD